MLQGIFRKQNTITVEDAATILKTTPEALEAFEEAYQIQTLHGEINTGNLFDETRKSAKCIPDGIPGNENVESIIQRIVSELLQHTEGVTYGRDGLQEIRFQASDDTPVTPEEIYALPERMRPQLTGTAAVREVNSSYRELLEMYLRYKHGSSVKEREQYYHLFRQGLDILDLDPVTYEMLGMNRNSMGYWLPELARGVEKQDYLRIPDTAVIKVPLPILQMSRLEYGNLTPATLRIVDQYCKAAFSLDSEKDYFVKTGTYSSKFNFRNAHVHGRIEVEELGEYLLYLSYQACVAAGPLASPCIYGMSTTNEWVVREYIHDKENNPAIYQRMPLHTEYRLFVDFDTDEILGMSPYWEPEMMKKRFGHSEDSDSPHNIHDYAIFLMHEDTLQRQYEQNKECVREHMAALIRDIHLQGQWSVDVMQNVDDFYIIDMALAVNSAFRECVPTGKLKNAEENWIPVIPAHGQRGTDLIGII